jgi:hypothetical protein
MMEYVLRTQPVAIKIGIDGNIRIDELLTRENLADLRQFLRVL